MADGNYATAYRCKINIDNTSIDLMGRFAIRVDGEIHNVKTKITGTWEGVPLGCPEEWSLAYSLIGREEKARLLKNGNVTVSLVPLSSDDAEAVYSLWSDESATLYTNFPYIPHLEGCRIHLQKVLSYYSTNPFHFGPFTIRSQDGTFLGLCGGDVVDERSQKYEIWYFIQRFFWGQKIATKAVEKLLLVMSESGRVETATAHAVVNNEPSWKFLEARGFKRTAFLSEGHKKDGRVFDLYVYSRQL
jgi:RimJ/RimL family protein N-acetyltransferase